MVNHGHSLESGIEHGTINICNRSCPLYGPTNTAPYTARTRDTAMKIIIYWIHGTKSFAGTLDEACGQNQVKCELISASYDFTGDGRMELFTILLHSIVQSVY